VAWETSGRKSPAIHAGRSEDSRPRSKRRAETTTLVSSIVPGKQEAKPLSPTQLLGSIPLILASTVAIVVVTTR